MEIGGREREDESREGKRQPVPEASAKAPLHQPISDTVPHAQPLALAEHSEPHTLHTALATPASIVHSHIPPANELRVS